MLDLILGSNVMKVVTILVIAFLIITLITLMAEHEFIRWLFGIPIFCVLVFSALYCYGRIDDYYSSSGGVIGSLTALIDVNKTEINKDESKLTYSFKNLQMQKDDKGYYVVEKTENASLLDKNETYLAYVNGYPCDIVNLVVGDDDSKFIYRFSYVFADYDDNGNLVPIADDTIQIEFTFYENSTNVKIKTDCTDEIYGLWNSYFNKNNFEITLEKASAEVEKKQELVTLTLMVNDETYSVIKLKKGSNYVLPTKIEKDGYIFNGFEINGEKVDILRNIQEDMTITANMIFELSVKEVEYYLFKSFGIEDGSLEKFIELEELEFYKQFWHGLTKENKEYSVTEYRQKIASLSLFKFEYDENCSFEEYLKCLYECIKEKV